MKTKLVTTLAACGLALGGFGFGLTGWANVDGILGRYPGAIRLQSQLIDVSTLARGAIQRQAVYETPDPQSTVKRWYAQRLEIAPADELYTAGTCAWLTAEQRYAWLKRDLSVLLCVEPHGTRVVVNESVTLGP